MGIAAQPDAATQIIDLSEVLYPELINAAQDHGAQDARPDLWAELRRLLVERLERSNLNRINQDCIFDNVVETLRWLNACASQITPQRFKAPITRKARRAVRHHDGARLCAEGILNGEVEIVAVQHAVTFAVDGGALLVDDIVKLNDALADVEVVPLNTRLCAFNCSTDHRRLKRL